MLGAGEHFAGYTVLRFLGAGGMGEVYLAQHPRLPRRRDALKLLGRDISADPKFRVRFLREADLASTLSHQHIVGVHDCGEDQGQLWIAMDYIDGEDAAELLRRRYPAGMPAELVAAIVTAVGAALDYAHGKGLLHRDVKPANIMLSNADDPAQRRILLTDFGIARALDDVSDLTPTNTTLGTVAYSAPEQLMGQELDGRADQYSLAATAYHLLTGTTMFPASNAAIVIGHHLSADPPSLAATRPELAALDPILRAALAKNPKDRFNSCTDFAYAFAEQARPGAAPPAAPTAPAPVSPSPPRQSSPKPAPPKAAAKPAPPPPKRTRWRVPVAIGSLSFIAAIGLAGALISRLNPPAPSASPPGPPSSPSSTAASSQPPQSSSTITTTVGSPNSSAASVVDGILLSAGELSKLLGGIPVYTDPGVDPRKDGLTLTGSTFGPTDHANQVTPPTCVGVIFTGDRGDFGGTDVKQMETQSFSGDDTPQWNEQTRSWETVYQGPHLVLQTAAVFPNAQDARRFFVTQQGWWNSCQGAQGVSVEFGPENGRDFTVGEIQPADNIVTVSMAHSNYQLTDACQQAMGIGNNVIVEARTCRTPSDQQIAAAPRQPGTPFPVPNPSWAIPDAHRLVAAMIAKIS